MSTCPCISIKYKYMYIFQYLIIRACGFPIHGGENPYLYNCQGFLKHKSTCNQLYAILCINKARFNTKEFMYNFYFIIDGETNMRPMGHIAHLRNGQTSLNQYKTCNQIHMHFFFPSFNSKLNELSCNYDFETSFCTLYNRFNITCNKSTYIYAILNVYESWNTST